MLNNKQLNIVVGLFAFILFCSFIHPFHIHPYRNFYHDVGAGLALFVGIGALCKISRIELSVPSSVLLPIGLAVFVGLQVINGFLILPMDGFFPIVEFLCLGMAMMFGATIAANPDGLRKLCFGFSWLFVLTGLVSLVFQHLQLSTADLMPFVMPIKRVISIRPYGNFGQPNILALIDCFALASVWWLYTNEGLRKWPAIGITVGILWGIALTQSRVAWVILPLFVLISCFQSQVGEVNVHRKVLLGLLLLFALMVLATPSFFSLCGSVVESVNERAAHTSVRLTLWQQAWKMSQMHPWFGIGWLQFSANQVMLASLFPPTELADYAHNIVLNFAAELGWPATVIILASSAYWFYVSCIKHWNDIQIRYIGLILIAIVVHSMVEFPLWNAFILIPFGVMVGAVHGKQLGIATLSLARAWMGIVAFGAVVAIVVACWDYQRVTDGFQSAYREQVLHQPDDGGTNKPEWTLFPQFFDYFRINKIAIYSGMPASDIEFLEKMSLNFGFPPVLERLALAYALNQRPAEAVQVLISSQRLNINYYPNTYALWGSYAKQNPAMFGQIFVSLPLPEKAKQP